VGSITGKAYTKSLLSTMTPYILSLGGFWDGISSQ
jgi:hypothetical protein